MTRRHAEIKNSLSTYIFCGIIPLCNFQYRNRARSITLIPFEIISRNLVQCKAEIKTGHSTYIICWIISLFNFRHKYSVRSLTLIRFDNFTKLGTNKSMTILWLWTVPTSTFFFGFSVLCHFVILYMVSMEIVSFCRIIPLCNFQYRNHVHSITLISFQIISQKLVQIWSMTGRHAKIKDCHFAWY